MELWYNSTGPEPQKYTSIPTPRISLESKQSELHNVCQHDEGQKVSTVQGIIDLNTKALMLTLRIITFIIFLPWFSI